jgi:hypothetical protein
LFGRPRRNTASAWLRPAPRRTPEGGSPPSPRVGKGRRNRRARRRPDGDDCVERTPVGRLVGEALDQSLGHRDGRSGGIGRHAALTGVHLYRCGEHGLTGSQASARVVVDRSPRRRSATASTKFAARRRTATALDD